MYLFGKVREFDAQEAVGDLSVAAADEEATQSAEAVSNEDGAGDAAQEGTEIGDDIGDTDNYADQRGIGELENIAENPILVTAKRICFFIILCSLKKFLEWLE